MESFANLGGCSNSTSKASLFQPPLSTAGSPAAKPAEACHGSPLALHQPGPSRQCHHRSVAGAALHGYMEISPAEADAVKSKIMSHPQYSALLATYLDCRKVNAPPDVSERLSAVAAVKTDAYRGHGHLRRQEPPPRDPELDQFMEAYCNMLAKYREELTRPIQEAIEFFKNVEMQLDSFTDSNCEGVGSSEDDHDPSGREDTGPCADDNELKYQLLKKYGGNLGSLRKEFSTRKKKGKLPKEARQKLLHWWELHYKWPYPSETEKIALAESTGLDQKQINNWFINQRKRHWKPSEDMPFAVVEGGFHPHSAAALYMDRPPFVANAMYRFES